ncbi:uncharacterized protein EURHEDRAFT_380514 [Aspergillus ruber CBS 135680]|uniref:Uncharacterized protein n=1 Tax=Aspergillus ruber (strain CBS 135680) TaxID=1388766 RepID=A0A017S7K7_ASPRC|nr:uncharacterized protein EURHEDRAFT_380514 [Aspergillus ruber CBS 135680]EYE92145.1 hypothetical protein EURHEDRAFT_380514 [Aspergillus ruber CBS 135680]
MADAYPETKQSSRGNHPRTSTLGGASAVPTPANNTGGGTGWGDKGFFKGGSQGTGHVAPPNAQATFGEYLPLQEQKGAATSKFAQRATDMNMDISGEGSNTSCQTEDHSFMCHRPGNSDTLPGWSKAKNAVEATYDFLAFQTK